MGKGYELEKRVLAMISQQYEGIYQLNLADKKVICIYDGRDAWGTDDVLDRDIWRDRLVGLCHPEDKENLQSVLAEDSLFLLGKKEAKTDKISRDFRFMIEQGYRWINLMLVPDPAHGQITVTFRNVTHRYEYDEIIRRKNMELRRMLQTAEQYRDALLTESVVLYQVNFSKNLIENEIFQRDKKTNGMVRVLNTVGIHTPCAYDEYCARWQGRVSKDTLAEYRKFSSASYMVEAYQDGKTLLRQDYRTLDSTGEEMWINKTIYLTKDNIQGDIIGIVSLRNVTDRYRQDYLRESLEKQASLDLLTGLYNHVTGELLIKSKIDNEKYVDAAFIIFDIDSFKKINDTHGHYFGDCVLQKVSDCLKGCIREEQDIAARYGGDEFVVFMTYKQEDDIKDIVERIFDSVSCQYEGLVISVSMGICLSSACDGGYYDLYKKADKSLYAAKAGGKGQYVYYEA